MQNFFRDGVFSIFKEQQGLTPDERAIYAEKLEYINRTNEELKSLFKGSQQVDETIQMVERQTCQLEKHIMETNRAYELLNNSMNRLNRNINEINLLSEEINSVWNKITKIEHLLEGNGQEDDPHSNNKEN